jgi:dTDP-4-amino-4,6-dideoxy-D-galactose acyltransferase
VKVSPLAVSDVELLQPLIRRHRYGPYRNHRFISRKTQAAVLAAEVQQMTAMPLGAICVDASGQACAAVVAEMLPWDSEFFGFPMARIAHVLANDAEAAALAIERVIEGLRAAGVRHVAARVDAEDLPTANALERRGFLLMDSLVTYSQRMRAVVPAGPSPFARVRLLEPGDADTVVSIAENAFRDFSGRFHADPHLAPRASAMYAEWARRCAAGAMADVTLVTEGADGSVIGFVGFRRREPVSTISGIAVFGGGLGACRADIPGGYENLIRAGMSWIARSEGIAEGQTQSHNYATIRIYEAAGLRFTRAEYTFHAWLGPECP